MMLFRTLPAGGSGGSGVADAKILAGAPAITSLTKKYESSHPGSTMDARDSMELQNGWPESRRTQQGQLDNRWRYGDMKDTAALYTLPAYEAMVSTCSLNKEPESRI